MGEAGELLATWYLAGKGLSIEAINVQLSDGELDVLATDAGQRVVVEVRTTSTGQDPIDAIGVGKRRRVERLARVVRADRVDFVGIRVGQLGFDVHWVPGSS